MKEIKKTAYIHIGMPKTGTTAIQDTLQRFFDEGKLDKFDMQFHYKDIWKLIRYFVVTKDKKYFIEQLHKTILKYSRKLGDNNIIFSDEVIATVWYDRDFTFRYDLLPLLAMAFKDYNIKVVVYLRRQDLLMESIINHEVKTGVSTCNNVNINYKELIDKCLEYFGQKSVIIRKYERENLYRNDAVTDFLHIVGLDELIDDYIRHKKSVNSSLSPRAFRIALADNKQYLLNESEIKAKIEELDEYYANGEIPREEYSVLKIAHLRHKDTIRWTDELCSIREKLLKGNSNFSVGSSNYGILSPEERADILARHAEDNAAVAREYFGSEDGKLFNDKVPTNIVDINTEPSATDIVQTFMPILIDLTRRCERLEMSPLRRLIEDCKGGVKKSLDDSPKLYAFARNVHKRFCK